jgi:hypothetical protein
VPILQHTKIAAAAHLAEEKFLRHAKFGYGF